MLLGFFALLLLGGRSLLSLPVERVVVTGDLKHVDRDALRSMISASLEGGFLWQDLQKLRTPLEALPWVHRVVVRRQWPDSIEVRVVEQRPIARWGDRSLLNHAGEVFEPNSLEQLPALPWLAGPEGSHELMMQRYLQVQRSLETLGLQISALEMDSRGAVAATLADGSELLFGRDALAEKLVRFRTLYTRRLAGRGETLARVDLRYSHGAAVAWHGDSAGSAAGSSAEREET
jgi:cell division protein FtsQ